jgi:hypothetical protein
MLITDCFKWCSKCSAPTVEGNYSPIYTIILAVKHAQVETFTLVCEGLLNFDVTSIGVIT